MKVLHIYRTYFPDPPGGLQEAIRQIAMATQREGEDVRVFTLSPNPYPEYLEIDDTDVVRAKSWVAPASCDIGGIRSFRRFAEQSAWADVIHFHFPWPFGDVLNLLVGPTKPKVMTYHSDIIRQRILGALYRPLMQRTLHDMDAVVATSPAYAQNSPVLRDIVSPTHSRMIPLGIDELSYPTQGDETVLQRMGLSDGVPFVLFIGVLRYYKGLHTLLEASALTQGRVVIAGSGPQNDVLQKQARHLGLHNVVFAGQVTDTEKVTLLKRCRALVLPSHLRSEAFGVVLVEASMFGKPMISCEIGTGTSFVNQHDETGLVIPPEDPRALAQAMNLLLAGDDLALQFGDAARKRYELLFSGPTMGKVYSNLYKELISK